MISDLIIRLRSIFRRRAVEADLNDELNFHLSHLTEKLVHAGLAPDEAARRARIELGGMEQTREECRHARGVSVADHLWQDTVYAVRTFRRNPGFTAAVAISLGLGIGANTAVFTLIDAVMWRTVRVADPASLLFVGYGNVSYTFTHQQFRTLRRDNAVMADLGAYSPVRLNVTIDGIVQPTAEGQMVSGQYFAILGVPPIIGRQIGEEHDVAVNGHPVAMISHAYWKRRFTLDPSVLGKTIVLSGVPFTIIGVTPPEFDGLEVGVSPDFFVPVMMQPTLVQAQENLLADSPNLYHTWLRVFGRLRPGVTAEQAAASLHPLFQRAIPEGKKLDSVRREKVGLYSAATGLSDLREPFAESLFILMGVVATVLLIACANIANLLLARAASRQPEFAMRLALGAGRRRLIGQLLVESTLLALIGGACGLAFAHWSVRFFVNFMSAGRVPIALSVTPDAAVLAFTAAASIVTGILFGLAPAIRASRADLTPALSAGGRGSTGNRRRLRADKTLAVVQVALSLTLLVGAGIFVRSLHQLNARVASGPRDSVLIARVEPKGSDQRNTPGASARLDRAYRQLIADIESIPGVESASMAQFTPTLIRSLVSRVELPDREVQVQSPMIYPGYFAVMDIPLVAGRDFNESDLSESAPKVSVVNETFAREVVRGECALGRRLTMNGVEREIIGVVKDSPYFNFRREVPPMAYQTFLQTNTGRGQMMLYARVRGTAGSVMPHVREAINRLDPTLPMFEIRTLSEELDAVLVRERLVATLTSVFGVLALALACVGLYGLLAFTITQRTTEMGVRMALGAKRGDVVLMVMREALTLVIAGTVAGLMCAVAAARLASSQMSVLLFQLSATDPLTIVAATLVLLAVASLASYLPARRASRVEPMAALRNQ
jgi:predicted permease